MSITYYRISLEELVPRLRDFFRDRREILLAAVFGSAVRRRLVRDLDLAILFRGKPGLMDLCRLTAELEDLTGIPIDLGPLDRAPPTVVLKALREGRMVFMRNRRIYSELLKKAVAEVMDLRFKRLERVC